MQKSVICYKLRLVIENYWEFFNVFNWKLFFSSFNAFIAILSYVMCINYGSLSFFGQKIKENEKTGGKNPCWIKCNACVLYGRHFRSYFLGRPANIEQSQNSHYSLCQRPCNNSEESILCIQLNTVFFWLRTFI